MISLKTVIETLRSKGVSVEAYKRKDGGWLIRSINGVKFEGAQGNAQARAMLGITPEQAMSEQKRAQLKGITQLRRSSSEFKRVYKETAKIWKAEVKKGNLKIKGRIKPQTWIKFKKEFGEEEAIKSLLKAQKYAQGIAYEENVLYYIEKLVKIRDGLILNGGASEVTNELTYIINYLQAHKDEIKEADLEKLIGYWYEAEHFGFELSPVKTMCIKIRRLLSI